MIYTSEKMARDLGEETKEILERTLGGEWKVEVWNDFGWGMRVTMGTISVLHCGGISYRCVLGTTSSNNVPAAWSDNCHYDTPDEAVRQRIKKALDYIDQLASVVAMNVHMMKKF